MQVHYSLGGYLHWWESAVSCLHPLGNIIQFHKLLSDPKDLNLTRHENCLVSSFTSSS